MRRRGDGPGVEFLSADTDSTDEDLPQRPARPRPVLLRVGVAAAVLLVGAAVVRAATDRHPPATAVTTTTVSASPPPPPSAQPRRDPLQVYVPRLVVPPGCPPGGDGLTACTSTHTLPAQFLAAVRSQFPATKTISTRTEVVRATGAEIVHALWSRQFTGEFGVTIVHVVVSTGLDLPPVPTTSFDDGIWVRSSSWYRAGALSVQVFASAPSGHEPASVRLDRLARDPRLLLLT
jgi:hypothetical protein